MKTTANDLKLPRFEIPDLPSKQLTPEVYRAWIRENLLRLRESGHLEKTLADPARRPVDARFSLNK